MSFRPLYAAKAKALQLPDASWLTSAPLLSNRSTAATWPFCAAPINAVAPEPLRLFMSMPVASKLAILAVSPVSPALTNAVD